MFVSYGQNVNTGTTSMSEVVRQSMRLKNQALVGKYLLSDPMCKLYPKKH